MYDFFVVLPRSMSQVEVAVKMSIIWKLGYGMRLGKNVKKKNPVRSSSGLELD